MLTPDTLTGTQIGGNDFGTVNETAPVDIASHGNPAKLYMIGADTDKLYEINTTTGATTRYRHSHRLRCCQ